MLKRCENIYNSIRARICNIPSLVKTYEDIRNFSASHITLLTALFCICITPSILENYLNGKLLFEGIGYILLGIFCIALMVGAIYLLSESVKAYPSLRASKVYFLVFFILICRNSFRLEYFDSCAALFGLALSIYIILIKKAHLWAVPVIALVVTLASKQFANEYMISLLAIYFLIKYDETGYDFKISDVEKKALSLAPCCLILSVLSDYLRNSERLEKSSMAWQFYNDYMHFGFITRGLVSTVRALLFGQGSLLSTAIFITVMHILSLGLSIFIILMLWKMTSKNDISLRLLIIALVCSEPFRNLGSTDMYIYYDCVLVLIALTCLFLLIKDRYIFLLLPLLGIGMCIHHGFAIFVFPMLFAVMVYRYLVGEGKAKLRYAVLILLSLLIVGCGFKYFHFVASAKDKVSFEDACQYMAECTDKDIPDDIGTYSAEDLIEQTGYFYVNIDYVMYDGKVKNYGIQVVHPDGLIYSAILWIIMIPLICLFFKTFRRVTPKGFDKLVSILTPFSLFIILIAYLEADYGRWNGFMILTIISVLISTYMISPENAFLTNDTHTSEKKWTPGKLIVLLMILIPNMGAFAR